jgi:fumarylacetoacetase
MPVPLSQAADHLFGVVLLDDWSARDIQAWEYVPLGPFLGKSFATSISAWVTPLAALEAARVDLPGQNPAPLPYLSGPAARGLDLHLEVSVNGVVISRPEFRDMYWSPEQMLAHLTVNGASLRDGDLFASGTVSGEDPATRGSLLELTWNGTEPITLGDNETRGFLEDGDVVTMTAWAAGPDGSRVGVGEVTGRVS